MSDKNRVLSDRGRALEDSFFARKNQALLDQMRKDLEGQEARDALATTLNLQDAAVLDRLVALGIRAETAAALCLVPLVEVAWADGKLDEKERAAILQASAEKGLPAASESLLQQWLESAPETGLLEAWRQYIAVLKESIPGEAFQGLGKELIFQAEAVAKASGGILGLGSKISDSESRVLEQLKALFRA